MCKCCEVNGLMLLYVLRDDDDNDVDPAATLMQTYWSRKHLKPKYFIIKPYLRNPCRFGRPYMRIINILHCWIWWNERGFHNQPSHIATPPASSPTPSCTLTHQTSSKKSHVCMLDVFISCHSMAHSNEEKPKAVMVNVSMASVYIRRHKISNG